MKKFQIVTFIVFSMILSIQAQDMGMRDTLKELDVVEEVRFMSQGEQNAFTLQINRTSLKMVDGVWDKYIRQFKGKTKTNKKTKEIMTDDAKMPEMSANSVDIYARFGESAGNTITAYVWFDLGGMYLNSEANPEKAAYAKNILGEFSRLVYKEEAMVIVDAEEKKLKELNQDLKKLGKEKDSFEKKIADAEELIAKMKANIELNVQQQDDKKVEISDQERQVNKAKAVVQSYN